mmetsp:Transcript_11914/g.24699  ORF Transcript_11914/g.24699 Transcript_11914/m.24699 type:complete len:90 (+) Transcript_11914:72-341(+)
MAVPSRPVTPWQLSNIDIQKSTVHDMPLRIAGDPDCFKALKQCASLNSYVQKAQPTSLAPLTPLKEVLTVQVALQCTFVLALGWDSRSL